MQNSKTNNDPHMSLSYKAVSDQFPGLPPIIGIYSPAPRCGKSTAASILWQRFGYIRVPFAETLKLMIRVMLEDAGYTANEIHRLENGDKKELMPFFNCDLRHLYTTLGTEWGRMLIHPDLWIKVWTAKVMKLNACGKRVVVEDVRFLNEIKTVLSRQGIMMRIDREGTQKINHLSEAMTPMDSDFAITIVNNHTLEDFEQAIVNTVKGYKP